MSKKKKPRPRRPRLSEEKREALSTAIERDLREVFEKHQAGGIAILATPDAFGWRPILPSWSGMKIEPNGKLVGTLNPLDEVGCLRLLRFLGGVSRAAVEAAGTMSAILTDIEDTLGYSYQFEEDEDEDVIDAPS